MKLFITGISTDVGKTIASAIITEALEADYWKPVQAGDLHNSDSIRVRKLIRNKKTVIHPEALRLHTAASPHLAAEKDGIEISLTEIIEPVTENSIVIEGAGGLFVPLNNTDTILDLIKPDHAVIIVSRHYLGSINHTMLTIEALQNRNLTIAGVVFSGDKNESTERFILNKSGVRFIGRINDEPYFDQNVIAEYAAEFRNELLNL
ncbi:MAG TPA: dethiobiotin synthase [Flavobacterium sp.]|jgi:dethiobiotin synthetase